MVFWLVLGRLSNRAKGGRYCIVEHTVCDSMRCSGILKHVMNVNRRFGGTCHLSLQLAACLIPVSYLTYCLTLKMDGDILPETSVNFQQTRHMFRSVVREH
jgi:hypothetical protein